MRCLTPWVDEWTFEAEHRAAQLRTIATSDWALENAHAESLEALADKLDEVTGFTHALGTGGSFEEVCREARANADDLMQNLIWPVKVDAESEAAVRSKVVSCARQLDSTWARAAKNVFDGRVEKAKEESARAGADLANWTYLPLAFLTEDTRPKLRETALGFVGLAAFRTYMDGGESVRRLVERGRQLTDELLEVARTL